MTRTAGSHSGPDTAEDGPGDPYQRPDSGNTDHARAEKAHVRAEHAVGPDFRTAGHRHLRSQDRQQHPPADDETQEHRHADRQADEMAHAQKSKGEATGYASRSRSGAEPDRRFTGRQPHLRENRKARGGQRVPDQHREALGALSSAFTRSRTDAQHLGRGLAFGIGQRRIDHERAAQRYREQHAKDAAGSGNRGRGPIGEALPPADHHEARQHEDNRGQRPGRARHGLDDVVFPDRRILEPAQDGHGNHGGGDRGSEGKAYFQAEIDVCRREQQRDHPAQQTPAQREFGSRPRPYLCRARFARHAPHLVHFIDARSWHA